MGVDCKIKRRFKNDFKLFGLIFFSWRVEEQNSALDTSVRYILVKWCRLSRKLILESLYHLQEMYRTGGRSGMEFYI